MNIIVHIIWRVNSVFDDLLPVINIYLYKLQTKKSVVFCKSNQNYRLKVRHMGSTFKEWGCLGTSQCSSCSMFNANIVYARSSMSLSSTVWGRTCQKPVFPWRAALCLRPKWFSFCRLVAVWLRRRSELICFRQKWRNPHIVVSVGCKGSKPMTQ